MDHFIKRKIGFCEQCVDMRTSNSMKTDSERERKNIEDRLIDREK